MKTHVSSRGQVVIPQHVRELLHLKEGMELEIEVDDDRLVLKKTPPSGAWRALQGKYKAIDLTKALEEEHHAEKGRDRKKGS